MFSHIMVGSNDIARSKKFYDALFTAIGAQPGTEVRRGPTGLHSQRRPLHGDQAERWQAGQLANGGTIGFSVGDPKLAEAWHKAGVANGGTSIEDAPGVRPNGAYLAYLRDPDGNKFVAVARPAS